VKLTNAGLCLCALIAAGTPAAAQDQLIAAAKHVPASALDSTLPAVSFERWLATLRPVAAIEWEVNDCGEGHDGGAAPTCVETTLHLGGDTTGHASLIVAGIDGKRSKPVVWDLSVAVAATFTGFKTLSDWAAHVRGRHP
jgi:hypothetical protein